MFSMIDFDQNVTPRLYAKLDILIIMTKFELIYIDYKLKLIRLHATTYYFLRWKRNAYEMLLLIVFQYAAVFPKSGDPSLIGCLALGFVGVNSNLLSS